MKKLLLGSIAFIALNGGSAALAADMLIKAPYYKAPIVVSSYSWTGLYVGVNAGGAWGKADVTTFLTGPFGGSNITAVGVADSPRLKPGGFIGGVQGGYNYQIGNIVLGVELDFDYLGLKNSQSGTFPYPVGGGTFTVSNSVQTNWLFTARPRIGHAFDRALIYATGGLAVTNVKYNESYNDVFATFENSSVSTTKAGWTIGGGLEYALTNNWSAKAEYLYADFGSVNWAAPAINSAFILNHKARLTTNIARAGLNYKFDSATGPIVAKY